MHPQNHAVTKALFSASLRILRNAIYHIYPLTGDYYYYCTILLFTTIIYYYRKKNKVLYHHD